MSAEINWGQEIIGQVPKSNLPYKVVDRPFLQHIYKLRRTGAGLPLEELPDERLQRVQAENKRLDALLMN